MAKIEKLNPEQQGKLESHKQKWIDTYLGGELSKFEDVVSSQKDLYKMCGLKEPVVLYAPDPLACQMYTNAFLTMFKTGGGNQVWEQVREQVRAQFGNQVWDQVGNQVGDQVGNQVWEQVR